MRWVTFTRSPGVKGSDHQHDAVTHDNAFKLFVDITSRTGSISQKSKRENPRAAISSQLAISVVQKSHLLC